MSFDGNDPQTVPELSLGNSLEEADISLEFEKDQNQKLINYKHFQTENDSS